MCVKEKRPVLYTVSQGTVLVFQPGCGQWDCPDCAEKLRSHWKARVRAGVETYQASGSLDWSFVTVTVMGYAKTTEACLYELKKKWPKLSTRMRRRWSNLKYVLIPEKHEDKRVHVHMIANIPWLPPPPGRIRSPSERWWKDNAAQCGLGFIADAKKCDSPTSAGVYAMKYMVKQTVCEDWPVGFRRVRTSRGWPDFSVSSLDQLEWSWWGKYWSEGLMYVQDELATFFRLPAMILGHPETTMQPR